MDCSRLLCWKKKDIAAWLNIDVSVLDTKYSLIDHGEGLLSWKERGDSRKLINLTITHELNGEIIPVDEAKTISVPVKWWEAKYREPGFRSAYEKKDWIDFYLYRSPTTEYTQEYPTIKGEWIQDIM